MKFALVVLLGLSRVKGWAATRAYHRSRGVQLSSEIAGRSPPSHAATAAAGELQRLVRLSSWRAALAAFEELDRALPARQLKARDRPSYGKACSYAIHACEKLGEWQLASRIHDGGRSSGVRFPFYTSAAVMRACSRAQKYEAAAAVAGEALQDLRRAGLINVNVGLKVWGHTGRHAEAQAAYDALGEAGLAPDAYTYVAMVYSWGRAGDFSQIEGLISRLAQYDPEALVIPVANAAIDVCCKGGRYADGLALARLAEGAGVVLDSVSYSMLILGSVHGGDALQLVAEATSRGCRPTPASFNRVLCNLASLGCANEALGILELMTVHGLPKSAVAFQAAMSACLKAGAAHQKRVLQLVAEMRSAGLEPDAIAWSMALKACEQAPEHANWGWRQAVALTRSAERSSSGSVGMRERTLGLLAARGKASLAAALWEELASGRPPTWSACLSVVDAHRHAGDAAGASRWFQRLLREKHPVGAEAATSAITACRASGDWKLAMGVYDEFLGSQATLAPTAPLANALLNVLGSAGPAAVPLVQRVQDDLDAAGVAWDEGTFTSLMAFYVKAACWREALALWDDQLGSPSAPPPPVAAAWFALRACEMGGSCATAESIIAHLVNSQGVAPKASFFLAAIRACGRCATPDAERAVGLVVLMEQGHREGRRATGPTAECYAAAIHVCDAANTWRTALHVLMQMIKSGYEPPADAFNAVVSACVKSGEWSMAFRIFEYMRRSGVAMRDIAYGEDIVSWAALSGILPSNLESELSP